MAKRIRRVAAGSSRQAFGVRLEGVRELTRALADVDPALRKELGQRNKDIGQQIIDEAAPKPEQVGRGKGARPRPSANANVLRIVAGGSWRAGNVPAAQWGARFSPRDSSGRPYIVRSGELNMASIERQYLDAVVEVASKAGLKARRR